MHHCHQDWCCTDVCKVVRTCHIPREFDSPAGLLRPFNASSWDPNFKISSAHYLELDSKISFSWCMIFLWPSKVCLNRSSTTSSVVSGRWLERPSTNHHLVALKYTFDITLHRGHVFPSPVLKLSACAQPHVHLLYFVRQPRLLLMTLGYPTMAESVRIVCFLLSLQGKCAFFNKEGKR